MATSWPLQACLPLLLLLLLLLDCLHANFFPDLLPGSSAHAMPMLRWEVRHCSRLQLPGPAWHCYSASCVHVRSFLQGSVPFIHMTSIPLVACPDDAMPGPFLFFPLFLFYTANVSADIKSGIDSIQPSMVFLLLLRGWQCLRLAPCFDDRCC